MMGEALARVLEGHDLDPAVMQQAMDTILEGRATPAQIAGLLIALRMKGESPEELAAAARAMRAHCVRIELPRRAVVFDTCGTGGDGAGTFNVSTLSAIVLAACGLTVAKHGNRAMSSKTGSADVLEALGVSLEASPEQVAACMHDVGIGFMLASAHHPAMRHAAPVRRELGVRTLFNLLGPLTNPASATHQLLGVYERTRVEPMAEVLRLLGARAAWVVHGEGGLDEISPLGPTHVAELRDGRVTTRVIHPRDFGLEPVALESLRGGDARENAATARRIFAGEKGPKRDTVLMNAAAALYVAGEADTLREGMHRAADALDSGGAAALLEKWVERSRQPAA